MYTLSSIVDCAVYCIAALAVADAELLADYVFSQQGCKDARWDFNDGIYFTRMLNATSCVHDESNGFDYWQTGAYLTRDGDLDEMRFAFASSPITNQLDSLTGERTTLTGQSNWTIAMWFTVQQPFPDFDSPDYEVNPLSALFGIHPVDWLYDDTAKVISMTVSPAAAQSRTYFVPRMYTFRPLNANTNSTTYELPIQCTGTLMNIPNASYAMMLSMTINPMTNDTDLDYRLYYLNDTTREYSAVCDNSFGVLGRVVDWSYLNGSFIRFLSGDNRGPSVYSMNTIGTYVHRFSMWNQYMDSTETYIVATDLTPNSVPSTKNLSLAMAYGEQATVDLNTSDTVRDFDEDPIIAIRLVSLPVRGTIKHDGSTVTEDDLPFSVTGELTYELGEDLYWSYPDCSATVFQFDASDNGQNFSVAESYVSVCVSDVNFEPTVVPLTKSLPRGSSAMFNVTGEDVNDEFDPPSIEFGLRNGTDPSEFRNTSNVVFHNVTGEYGSIYLADCETPVVALDEYPLATSFCYGSSRTSRTYGTDAFAVTVSDAVSTSIQVLYVFETTNPLVAVGASSIVNESPAVVSIALPVYDAFEDAEVLPQIASLPLNGTLRFKGNNSLVHIGDLVDGNVTYVASAGYFNQFSSGSSTNFYGESVLPLETFNYRARDVTLGQTGDVGTVSIVVKNTFDPVESVSGLGERINVTAGLPYTLGDLVQVVDNDREEFCIGVYLASLDGRISVNVNQSEIINIGPNSNSLLLSPCGSRMDDGCDDPLWFSARPRYVNYLLSKLMFEAHVAKSSLAASITVRIFKPGPGGVTPENFNATFATGEPQITGKVLVTVTGTFSDHPTQSPVVSPTFTPTKAPTRGEDLTGVFIASIVLSAIGVALALGTCAVVFSSYWPIRVIRDACGCRNSRIENNTSSERNRLVTNGGEDKELGQAVIEMEPTIRHRKLIW